MKIAGAVALITGGASGLGLATAQALHDRGSKVVLLDLPSSAGHAGADTVGAGAAFTPRGRHLARRCRFGDRVRLQPRRSPRRRQLRRGGHAGQSAGPRSWSRADSAGEDGGKLSVCEHVIEARSRCDVPLLDAHHNGRGEVGGECRVYIPEVTVGDALCDHVLNPSGRDTAVSLVHLARRSEIVKIGHELA